MTSPEDQPEYATSPFTSQVHQDRQIAGTSGLAQNALAGMRGKLIESIMQLIAQAITGILTPFGLGSAFTQLSDWATDITDQLTYIVLQIPVIGDLVEWLASLLGIDLGDVGNPSVDFGSIWSNIVNVFINPLGFFANLVGGFVPPIQVPGIDASKIISGFIGDGLLPIINSIWSGLTGLIPGGPVAADAVGGAVGSQTSVVAAIAAAVAKLEVAMADLDPDTILVEDAFEYSDALGPAAANWDMYDFAFAGGSGALNDGQVAADGHQIVWLEGGGGFNHGKRFMFKGTNAESTNDNMTVKMVLGSPLLNPAAGALNGLIARAKADMSEFLELRIDESGISLWWITGGGGNLINGGNETRIGTPIALAGGQPGAGSVVSLDCGMTPGHGSRYFVATVNSTQYIFDDVTSISAVSSAHRHRGFMMCAGRVVFFFAFFQKACGAVAHWASQNAA